MKKTKNILLLHLIATTIFLFGCNTTKTNREAPPPSNTNPIYQVDNLNLIKNQIKHLDESCLVVFDIDETLITPVDKLLHLKGVWDSLWFYFFYMKTTYDFLCSDVAKHYNTALLSTRYQLVDKRTPTLIRRLQRKGVKVIGMTSLSLDKTQPCAKARPSIKQKK